MAILVAQHKAHVKQKARSALLFISLCVATLAGLWVSYVYLIPPRARNLLDVPADALNLGERYETREIRHTLPLKNTSSRIVVVERMRVSCGCTKVSPTAFILEPGATQELSFVLNVSQAISSTEPSHPFEVAFAPLLKDGFAMSDGWVLHAELVSPISLEPAQISYQGENRLVAGQDFSSAYLQVHDQRSGIELRLRCPPSLGTAAINEANVLDEGGAGSSTRSIAFSPADSLRPGIHEDHLEIDLWLGGKQVSTMLVPIVVEVVGLAEARPRAIDFGFADTHGTASSRVLLAPTGMKPLKVITDLGQEADIRISCPQVLQGQPEWLTVELLSAEAGRHEATARVALVLEESSADSLEVLEIPFTYIGTPIPRK